MHPKTRKAILKTLYKLEITTLQRAVDRRHQANGFLSKDEAEKRKQQAKGLDEAASILRITRLQIRGCCPHCFQILPETQEEKE